MSLSNKPTAAMNEQTVAYSVVPVLKELLETVYPCVIPINFWSTREGTCKARSSFSGQLMKVVAVYPRRPKTLYKSPCTIFIKLNQELYNHAAGLDNNGIPVIAVAPLVNGPFDLQNGFRCCYLLIDSGQSEQIVTIDENRSENNNIILSNDDLLALIEKKAKLMDYTDVISAIRNNSKRDQGFFLFNRWGQYKPVYFLCLANVV